MIMLVLLTITHGAYAMTDCSFDGYGDYKCSTLTTAERVGIGIGTAALLLLALLGFIMHRRRRAYQINQVLITHPNMVLYQEQYQPQPSYDPACDTPKDHQGGQSNPNEAGAWNSRVLMNHYPKGKQSHDGLPDEAPPGYTPPTHPPPTKEHF